MSTRSAAAREGAEMARRVLLVDDDPDQLALLERWLSQDGYEVEAADSGEMALRKIETFSPALVLTDMVMDGIDGLRLLRAAHRLDAVLPIVMMSAHARVPDAVSAAQLGVSAFLIKPIDRAELRDVVKRFAAPRSADVDTHEFAPAIIHRSPSMATVLNRARLVSEVDSTVLISGSTGTGKELLARAIHDGGTRREQPFTTVNCSALPEQLLESELFGHERGAFTGAQRSHEGLFRATDGGTLFLDEIGDLPLAVQAKLLRVLQELRVRPVGSTVSYPINVRILAATHVDLERAVRERCFREDLFYRISVVPLRIPDLSERREDIAPIVSGLLDRLAERYQRPRRRFSPDALERLEMAPWPGNVRQLANAVEQCWVLSPSDIISGELVATALDQQPASVYTLEEARQQFERRYLTSVLRLTGGKVNDASRLAGRNRTEFYRLLKRHGLDAGAFRVNSESASLGIATTPGDEPQAPTSTPGEAAQVAGS